MLILFRRHTTNVCNAIMVQDQILTADFNTKRFGYVSLNSWGPDEPVWLYFFVFHYKSVYK